MPKIVRFIELDLENFTEHRGLTVRYGRITRLSGRNGVGKTSIGTAPVWVLFGTDLFGRKWSPRPVTYDADVTRAAIIIEVDGKQVKFERGIDGGDNVFLLNDVPTKAREFDAAVASLFDRDEFLSLYNPAYFFTLHWTKQREMILRHTPPPANFVVLNYLSGKETEEKVDEQYLSPQAQMLAKLMKKHNLNDLEKIHRDRKNRLEKDHIAAQSRTRTLRERLLQMDSVPNVDPANAQQDIAKIEATIVELEKTIFEADETNREFLRVSKEIDLLTARIEEGKREYGEANEKTVDTHCELCGQELTEEAKAKAEQAIRDAVRAIAERVNPLIQKRKKLREYAATLEYIDVSEKLEELRRWQEAKRAIQDAVREKQQHEHMQREIEKARADEAATLEALNESIFIIDAIKAYKAKEAELQAEKAQSLFKRLTIRLHKELKNGEIEPDFSIQMDGKDFAMLSTGEKIEAGLELSEALFKQSELITPVFVDGIGEYTGPIAVYDQLITAGAVRDQDLKIETEGWAA